MSNVNRVVCLKYSGVLSYLLACDDDSLQNQLLAFLFICLMKPGAFNATIFIRRLAQATGEVDGEESWRVFTPKRASRGTAAGAVFWWLREQQTPPHPSEESSVWKLCPSSK